MVSLLKGRSIRWQDPAEPGGKGQHGDSAEKRKQGEPAERMHSPTCSRFSDCTSWDARRHDPGGASLLILNPTKSATVLPKRAGAGRTELWPFCAGDLLDELVDLECGDVVRSKRSKFLPTGRSWAKEMLVNFQI